jgi:hypothetical protein
MSQSTTFYRISKDKFRELETSGGEFEISSAKNYVTFEGSFMALEFILSKDRDDPTAELVSELFNPGQSIGEQNPGIDDFDFEEFDFDDMRSSIPYLDVAAISSIHAFLDQVSTEDIESLYDAEELNSNGIYPELWRNDNSPEQAFNLRHVSQDFEELRSIVRKAGCA